MIQVILGKKGSGKSTLSKQLAKECGGRILFFSPVEDFDPHDLEVWGFKEAKNIRLLRPGESAVIRRMDSSLFEYMACIIHIYQDFTLVIDETEQYKDNPQLPDVIHYARHHNIDIIANTRRYTDMPRLMTSQADIIYVFRTNEPRDIQYLKNFDCFVEEITRLEKYNYIKFPYGEKGLTKV